MMRATTRRCPGPESIGDSEASAGSSSEGGKFSVSGTASPQHCFIVGKGSFDMMTYGSDLCVK